MEIDFKARFGWLYFPSAKTVAAVNVPAMHFAMVNGTGDPNGSVEYAQALDALFGVSYTAKFSLQRGGVARYKVAPSEGLWWTDGGQDLLHAPKATWRWTAMIMQPGVVTPARFRDAVSQLRERKDPPPLSRVRFERFQEGRAAQILYIGPYAKEGPTIGRLHQFIEDQGGRRTGKHHEIYLSDPRRTPPQRLKTVIRQPFVD